MQTIQLIKTVYPNFENSKDNPESYYLLRFMENYIFELNEEDVFVFN
ncbi:MAG: ribonucleotide-diphosphate reductase subunit beta [Crocosphaera sp.]